MSDTEADGAFGDADAGFVFRLYHYTPSLPGAVVSVVVFAVLTAAHIWLMLRYRSLYFTAFNVGGIFQVIGYCGRIWSHYDEIAIGGFVIQAILILVAPALYAASIYMILGRIIRAVQAEALSPIPVRWLTKIFVTGDVVAFSLQAGGGGIQAAGTLEMYDLGEKFIIVGLFVQIAIFSIFIFTSLTAHHRVRKSPTPAASDGIVPWQRHLHVLYATSILILVRSIFRVIEYLQGNSGYLISREIYLYIFDTVLMAAVMLIFAIWYIGDLEPNKANMYAVSSISLTSLVRDDGTEHQSQWHRSATKRERVAHGSLTVSDDQTTGRDAMKNGEDRARGVYSVR